MRNALRAAFLFGPDKALNLSTILRFADVPLEFDTKPLEERQ